MGGGVEPATPGCRCSCFGGVQRPPSTTLPIPNFSGGSGYCGTLNTDIRSDSQTYVIRQVGRLGRRDPGPIHADNDLSLYS